MDRPLCTVKEIIEDLGLPGSANELSVLGRIQAASQAIEQTIGVFIPYLATAAFVANPCKRDMVVPALLDLTSLSVEGVTIAASLYALQPGQRHWDHGPYSCIALEDEGGVIWSDDVDENVVTGKWGMYDLAVDLGVTITSASASDTTLTVADGSKCSPGMVLLVESEQMVVVGTGAASSTTATLNGAIDDASETIVLSDGTKVAAGEVIKIEFEQMRVLDVAGDAILVTRGWNGSKRDSHASGTAVLAYRTYTVRRGVNGTIAAVHTSKSAYQYQAPTDINYLARQMACLMIKKAQTGYVGRSGNDELGSGFFVNEFPKNQIDFVKSNYPWMGG